MPGILTLMKGDKDIEGSEIRAKLLLLHLIFRSENGLGEQVIFRHPFDGCTLYSLQFSL